MQPFKIVTESPSVKVKAKRAVTRAIPKHLGLLDIIALAWTRPAAMVVGMFFGAAVSGGVFWVWHHELHTTAEYTARTFLDPRFVLVVAGLVYSLHSVTELTLRANGKLWKAIAFAIIVECVMVLSTTEWLTVVALAAVASLNALGAGLVLVRGSRAMATTTDSEAK